MFRYAQHDKLRGAELDGSTATRMDSNLPANEGRALQTSSDRPYSMIATIRARRCASLCPYGKDLNLST
ncbi:MAG TPA: hypothetical protein VLR89_09430 [Anaerolineaceae bacterium]|nr:hypothetical protein [Anaerolineaceae bacterium]